MSEFVAKSGKEPEERKWETRGEVRRLGGLTVFIVVVTLLAFLLLKAAHAQDKYSLISPGGIAFSDFRGYEDWADVSSARQDEILKVIVADPKMIGAFKAGVPGNGQPFPEGSMIVKLQQKAEEEHGGAIRRGCARRLQAGFRHGEGQQKISENRRVGIRGFQLRRRIGQVHGRCHELVRLRKRVPHDREGEGLHLPPVREALS